MTAARAALLVAAVVLLLLAAAGVTAPRCRTDLLAAACALLALGLPILAAAG